MTPIHVITETRCLGYSQRGHAERPERIVRTIEKLQSQNDVHILWDEPIDVPDEIILRAHSLTLLKRLEEPYDFDTDTPYHPGIHIYARRSVGGALVAMNYALQGKPAFSLMRPPGHHATRNRCMGFCYLNSIAIATLEAAARGIKRIAIFDFDAHHGNGTEEIVHNHPSIIYVSVHQSPCYPGTGIKNREPNCYNFPMPPGCTREEYLQTLSNALGLVHDYAPELIAVSAGFDPYRYDPLTQLPLELEDFYWLGNQIQSFRIPTFSILEGGYSLDLPNLILAYIKGLVSKAN